MKIYFLFLCLIAQKLCSMDLSLTILESKLHSASHVTSYGFNPNKVKKIIAKHKTAEVAFLKVFNGCITESKQALNKYENKGRWGMPCPVLPWVWKTAYGMGTLGIALEAAIIVTKGATNPWMLAPLPLLAPVVGRFCFHQYYIRQAKNLISFMQQTMAELEASRSDTQAPDAQIETSAVPSNKKKTQSSCSIL